jgi:hypothetical protein
LRELLAKYHQEQISIEEIVNDKLLEVKRCEAEVQRLKSALKIARHALDIYQKHRDHLLFAQNTFSAPPFTSMPLFNGLASCENIEAYLGRDIPARNGICKVEIDAVK